MANKSLFKSIPGPQILAADAINAAGGKAYAFSPEHALSQYAVTGALNGTFYASGEAQLSVVLELASKVEPKFLAQLAVYSRESGLMKDMPALLLSVLATKDVQLVKQVFSRVCDDAKMVKNFVQIVRSGQVGRKSLGTALKKLVQKWLESRTEEQLFRAVAGGDPSLADIIKMVHPKPSTPARAVFYKYLIGKTLNEEEMVQLPANIQAFEAFKKNPAGEVPDVPFQLLTNLTLNTEQYTQVGLRLSWAALRQSLNVLAKNGALKNELVNKAFAVKLADAEQVRRAKAMPFQLYSAYEATKDNAEVPAIIANALQDAMDVSLSNAPELPGTVVVAVDISGSMSSAITGNRGSATSKVTCAAAAALMAGALFRRNPNTVRILPFHTEVVHCVLNPRDSVMTNAGIINKLPGGGTDCSSVLSCLIALGANNVSAVIYLSDNESWIDPTGWSHGKGTVMMQLWNKLKQSNPNAKLVCIDMQPNATTQAPDRPDIINIGGFSDSVFLLVDKFLNKDSTGMSFVDTVKRIEI
jgi:60 kDa SS-A/Ro ribonucleoprotein